MNEKGITKQTPTRRKKKMNGAVTNPGVSAG